MTEKISRKQEVDFNGRANISVNFGIEVDFLNLKKIPTKSTINSYGQAKTQSLRTE